MSRPTEENTAVTIDVAIDTIGESYARYRLIRPHSESSMFKSVRRFGQLTPVVVDVEKGGGHEMIDGFKRLRCARTLGMGRVPCVSLGADEAAGILEVLKSILDAMKEEIIAVDGKGEILYANKAAWKVAGGPEGETGRITSLSDILAPGEDLSAVTRPSGSAGTGEGPAGFRLTMRDGSSRLVETRDLLIQDQPAGSRLMVLKSVK